MFRDAERARNSQIQADIYAQIRQLGVHAAEFPGWFLDALADDGLPVNMIKAIEEQIGRGVIPRQLMNPEVYDDQ